MATNNAVLTSIGFTAAEKLVTSATLQIGTQAITVTLEDIGPLTNANLANAFSKAIASSPAFSDTVVRVSQNTILLATPEDSFSASRFTVSVPAGQPHTATVNAPSGIVNGINYGQNPWSEFLSLDVKIEGGSLFVLNPENNHFYEYEDESAFGSRTLYSTDQFQLALRLASEQSFEGLRGYLATVTSSEEGQIVQTLVGDRLAYIGGSDKDKAGEWRWIAGPENGQLIGASGQYTNWYPGEPSNNGFTGGSWAPGIENALAILGSAPWSGRWNDTGQWYAPGNEAYGFVIEYGGLPAEYTLRTSSVSVNEGSSVTITVDTVNVRWGTTLSYSITGIQQADLSAGQLSGTVTVEPNGRDGRASISVPLASDQLTEGSETLRVTVQGQTASVTVNDTSKTAPPVTLVAPAGVKSYTAGKSSTQVEVSKNSSGEWIVSDGSLQTKLVGFQRITFTDKAIALDNDAVASQAYRIYKAAFNREPDAGGLGYWIANMDAGMSVVDAAARFIDSPEFRSLYGSNPSNADFLTKVYTNVLGRTPDKGGYDWWLNEMNTNPARTKAKVLADFSESAENISGTMAATSTGISFATYSGPLIDLSPTFSLLSNVSQANEGDTLVFTLETQNVSAGTSYPYTISGVDASDLSSGTLTGTLSIDSSGKGTVSLTLARDQKTEGSETLTLGVASQNKAVSVNDTSTAAAASPTYSLSVDKTVANEGDTIIFSLLAQNVAQGTVLQYEISGVSASDLVNTPLFGTLTVTSDGVTRIAIELVKDGATEGDETLQFKVANQLVGVVIRDTDYGGGGGGGGGGG